MNPMRFIILLSIILILNACSKEASLECSELNCELVGSWDWMKTYGSIAGQTWDLTNSPPKQLEVTEGTLRFISGNQINEYDYVIIETDTMFRDNVMRKFIKYDGNIRWMEISNDSLVFRDLCFDCYDDYYVKN